MKLQNHYRKILTASMLCISSTHALAAVTATYTLPSDPALPSADGWTGDDLANWVAGNKDGTAYLRNSNDGDNTITRALETGILATDTAVTLNITARITSNFAQYGISDSTGSLLYGVGTDFSASNRYFIVLNGTRTNVGAAISGDDLETLSLVLDASTGQAELFVDSVSFGTATSSSGAGLITELVGADILYHRGNSRFTGAGVFQVDTTPVPEPSSTALLGLGSLALILRRKK